MKSSEELRKLYRYTYDDATVWVTAKDKEEAILEFAATLEWSLEKWLEINKVESVNKLDIVELDPKAPDVRAIERESRVIPNLGALFYEFFNECFKRPCIVHVRWK